MYAAYAYEMYFIVKIAKIWFGHVKILSKLRIFVKHITT